MQGVDFVSSDDLGLSNSEMKGIFVFLLQWSTVFPFGAGFSALASI